MRRRNFIGSALLVLPLAIFAVGCHKQPKPAPIPVAPAPQQLPVSPSSDSQVTPSSGQPVARNTVSQPKSSAQAKGKHPPPPPADIGTEETGIASWYGPPYHGRRAANGEIYDMEQMTAAHKTLPFDTYVRVDDLDTGKQTEVRITDRGPFVDGRIIDLSKAAAREIAMLGPGTANVRVTVIRAPESAEPEIYGVQIGAFRSPQNAEALRERMETAYGHARIVKRADSADVSRVVVGEEKSLSDASALGDRIRVAENLQQVFVVRIDTPPSETTSK